jgi:peptidoglycan/LPS O-acetylase OafA/YrhL
MLSTVRASLGLSIVAGLATGGIIGVALDMTEVPGGSAIGAFVGGLIAALLLCSGRRKALIAGVVVGLFSFPIQLSIFLALVSSHVYTPPQVPEISQEVLLVALGATVLMQVVGGGIGGLLGSIIRHPPPGTVEVPKSSLPPPPGRPEKYCIQCGAGLAKETQICPACGARQPS